MARRLYCRSQVVSQASNGFKRPFEAFVSRRVIRSVFIAGASLLSTGRSWILVMVASLKVLHTGVAEGTVRTTIYAGSHFEVRDHEQPTKYVFNGATRVAAVTGSLSTNTRIQRVRLHPGWNLLALAVTANNALGQFNQGQSESVSDIYEWNPATSDYSPVTTGQSVAAGTVLWIKVNTDAVVGITGSYTEPTGSHAEVGGAYLASTGLEAWSPNLPPSMSAWTYDAASKLWHNEFTGDLTVLSDPPPTLAPGEVLFVRADTAADLEIPDPTLRIRYYHEDHLGSSSVITDAQGALVEETAFYPFGHPRHEYRLRQVEEPYGFTQKERDLESGLSCFGKRFYAPTIGRWLSTDPLEEKGGGLNLYTYAKQNPLKYVDPDGAEVKIETKSKGKNITHYSINVDAVMVNESAMLDRKGYTQDDLRAFAKTLEKTIHDQYSGSEGGVSWELNVKIELVERGAKTGTKHVFHLQDPTKKSTGGGEAEIGGLDMTIMAYNLTQHRPGPNEHDGYATTYKSPEGIGAHELGHSLGLKHLEEVQQIKTDADRSNLMYSHRMLDSKKVTRTQIETIYNRFK